MSKQFEKDQIVRKRSNFSKMGISLKKGGFLSDLDEHGDTDKSKDDGEDGADESGSGKSEIKTSAESQSVARGCKRGKGVGS
jgi:hypothetical protein